ncbi:MAG: SpoIIE family protein phosphatase, partial [Olsenella sp.]|nr:SpoIIE family protein phosphatase [Olsenella sp.]
GQKLLHARGEREISQVIQTGMLGVVIVGFVITVGFTFALQQSTTTSRAVSTLAREIGEVQSDIRDASDANLLERTRRVAKDIVSVSNASNVDLGEMARAHDVSEVYVVNADGIIVASNNPTYVGFDMHSGEQSREFLDLLPAGRSLHYVQDYRPMAADESEWRKIAGVHIEGGFVQAGYDTDEFLDDIVAQVRAAVANRCVGAGGFIVVMTEDGKFLGSRKDMSLFDSETRALMSESDSYGSGELFRTSLYGVDYYAIHQDVEGLRAVALLPVAEAVQSRDLAVIVTSFMEVLVLAALFAAIYILIRHVVVNNIWQVNGTLEEITSGNLEAQVDVRDSTEFASLSDDINRTVGALRGAIAAEARRIESDLATAKAIQVSALPRTFPPFPDVDAFDIYASMNAAREVGGDFYDFYLIDDHTLGFLIADVSGKGIPAALFMMSAKTELANYMKRGIDLAEAVRNANCNLCASNDAGMFVTVWAATLDYRTGRLTYVNAGHNPPLLRRDGSWSWLKKRSGPILGLFEHSSYESSSVMLEPGDELLLYTDGVNEAFNANEEEYGNDRLEAFLAKNENVHPRMLVDLVRADLRKWSVGAEQSDDITMLCIEYGVPPEVTGLMTVRATTEGAEKLRRRMDYDLSQFQCPASVRKQIDLTVEELFVNVCEHGYDEQDEPGDVQLSYMYNSSPNSIVVSLADWGRPFDPTRYKPAEDDDDDLLTGIGVRLALANVDDAVYVRDGDRNVIAFRKNW